MAIRSSLIDPGEESGGRAGPPVDQLVHVVKDQPDWLCLQGFHELG
jgi:hypothetical protein